MGQHRGVSRRLLAASPTAAQTGPKIRFLHILPPRISLDTDCRHCTAQRLPAQGDWGALEWSSPKKEGPNVCLLPYSGLLPPSLRSSPCSTPGAIHPAPFGGCVLGVLSKDLPDHCPPRANAEEDFQAGSSSGMNLGLGYSA